MYEIDQKKEYLLITDVDDTILDNSGKLSIFSNKLKKIRKSIVLVYNSGRSCASLRKSLMEVPCLPAPDYLSGNLGTEIQRFISAKMDSEYRLRLQTNWFNQRINIALNYLPFERQPDKFQSDFKFSYYANSVSNPVGMTRKILKKYDVEASVIYSSQKNLDVIPLNGGKGQVAEYIRKRLGFSKEKTIVAGDSGNDLSMFNRGYKGIIVGNAHPELKALASENNYLAVETCAEGVLEGLNYWNVIPSGEKTQVLVEISQDQEV